MSFKHCCSILVLALAAGGAFGQTPPAPKVVGTVKNVSGLVTRSDAESATNVAPNTPVAEGQRFVTSSNASIEFEFGDGCAFPMGSNRSIVINTSVTCTQRQESISVLAAAGLFGGGSGSLVGPALFGASQLAGASLVARPPSGSASGTNGGGGNIPTPPISGQ